jgi:hypothetical protein
VIAQGTMYACRCRTVTKSRPGWISGMAMRCLLAQRDMRDSQGVIAVAATVATPMNFRGYCRTTPVTFSQVSDQSRTSSDASGVHNAQRAR